LLLNEQQQEERRIAFAGWQWAIQKFSLLRMRQIKKICNVDSQSTPVQVAFAGWQWALRVYHLDQRNGERRPVK
jgi:hypothetical protein